MSLLPPKSARELEYQKAASCRLS